MLRADDVKDIILEELQARGYAPNPADVMIAVSRIMEAAKEEVALPAPPPPRK